MGRAVANASNAAQGWRGGQSRQAAQPEPPPESVTVKNYGMSKKGKGGCCFPTGNSHRAGNDDGSRHTRSKGGGMSAKHHSPAMKG